MAAFVGCAAPALRRAAAVSSFLGEQPAVAAQTPVRAASLVMRLGTVRGNSSLDKLGLDKAAAERPRVYSASRPAGFSADYEEIISSVYRQVFGNAYIMESERAEMAVAESQFRDTSLTVKEFVRALAKTEQYKKRFFDARPLYAAIELNFKHFLGRTPDGLEEYRAKSAVYDAQGYDAFVDAFFDDGEYDSVFDDFEVPYMRGYKTESKVSMSAFTHFFSVYRGSSTSDKSIPSIGAHGIPLNYFGITKTPVAIVAPGARGSTYVESFQGVGSWNNGRSGLNAARTISGTSADANGKAFRVEVSGFSQNGASMGGAGVSLRSRTGRLYSAKGYSTMPRANKSYIVGKDELNKLYQMVTKNGGKIASITPL